MGISQSKLDWLKSIGAKKLPEPITSIDKEQLPRPLVWRADDTGMYYSNEYLSETPLQELKSGYERYKKWFQEK